MSDLLDTIERLREARELEELRAEVARLRAELESIRRHEAAMRMLNSLQSIPSEVTSRAMMQSRLWSIVSSPSPSLWGAMFGGG